MAKAPKKAAAKPAPDAQSGQEGSTDAKAAVKAKQAETADQFAEADAKADPAAEVSEEDLQVQREVRPW